MILSKDAVASKPGPVIESKKQGQESKNLLDLSRDDVVFYVGGYPANFTVSSAKPKLQITRSKDHNT